MEKEKLNHNFVQIYRKRIPELRWPMKKSGVASSILNFIMEHMDSKNALICSQQVFMDYFEISRPTVARVIKLSKTENKDYFYRNQFDKFKELRRKENIKKEDL